MLRRLWNWLVRLAIGPDPWEPGLLPGQFMIRDRQPGSCLPGRVLAVCRSAAAAEHYIQQHRLVRYIVTTRATNEWCESATERSAWRLLRPNALSPQEVAARLEARGAA